MYQLIMKNPNEPNWTFNDKYENFDELLERIKRTLENHKKEIIETGIYDLKPFEIKIYKIENTSKVENNE